MGHDAPDKCRKQYMPAVPGPAGASPPAGTSPYYGADDCTSQGTSPVGPTPGTA